MKNTINTAMISLLVGGLIFFTGCGGAGASSGSVDKTTAPGDTRSAKGGSGAAPVVKQIYDDAIKGNCSAIPPQLTDEFRKAVGTSKDELDALCDSFTDSKKIASAEVKSEEISGDSGKVKVALTHRDGKIEEKDERVKKVDGKWVMDS
jgi:hypothetical protein